jgi:hypothetical protein
MGFTEPLLRRELIAANDRFDPLSQPSAWQPGASDVTGNPWS